MYHCVIECCVRAGYDQWYQMIDYLALVALVCPGVRLRSTRWAVLACRGPRHVLEFASSARDACVGVV